MNAPAFGRDVAPLGRKVGATGFARGAPHLGGLYVFGKDWTEEIYQTSFFDLSWNSGYPSLETDLSLRKNGESTTP